MLHLNDVASDTFAFFIFEKETSPIKDGEIEAEPKAADHPIIRLAKGEVVVVVTRQVFCFDLGAVVPGAVIQKFGQRQEQLTPPLALLSPALLPLTSPSSSSTPSFSRHDCNILQASLHKAIQGLELIRVQ